MIEAQVVATPLALGADSATEIFLLQWHTELSEVAPLSAPTVALRRSFMDSFSEWWARDNSREASERIQIILAPELSVPISLVRKFDDLTVSTPKPMLIIAGLEFIPWQKYVELLDELPGQDTALWAASGGEHLHVNAAMVWIGDGSGGLTKYIQPKRLVSREEETAVFTCDRALLFRSIDQRAGRRLNFCVQVCSDFTHPDAVLDLRKSMETKCPGSILDFTVVLQMNEDQDADQFAQAKQAYFSEPCEMAITDPGCLVFVNNANAKLGKSHKYGRSAMHFEYGRKWKPGVASPTYALEDNGGLNFQAAVLRESGPSVYRLRYKPHYLVSRRPGAGQSGPLLDVGLCCPIPNEHFDPSRFAPILPCGTWLANEWAASEGAFRELLEGLNVCAAASEDAIINYRECCDVWKQHFKRASDLPARRAAVTYFESFESDGFPAKTLEPQHWCEGACRGAARFQAAYSLLCIAFGKAELFPDVGHVHHASLGARAYMTMIWGGGERPSRQLIQRYLNALQSRGQSDAVSEQLILVLVDPIDHQTPEQLSMQLADARQEITEAEPENGLPAHLAAPGEVVDPCANQTMVCISDSAMYSLLGGVASSQIFRGRLQQAVAIAP